MIESVAHVRRTIAEGDVLLVSFGEHDAYFHARGDIRAFFEQPGMQGRRVHFRYDVDLNISEASDAPEE
jgi:hypothetical protein